MSFDPNMDVVTIKTYNLKAKEYDEETVDFWGGFPGGFLDRFAGLVRGSVLDISSGPGRDGLLLTERGLDITCLDASEAMAKLSRERGLKTVVGDFAVLPFAAGSFDGVWAYTSLLHVPKSEAASVLGEIRRALKSGGIFGFGQIEGETEGYRESSGGDLPRWFSFYTQVEAQALLESCGFEILHFEGYRPRSRNYLNFIARKCGD